MSCLNFKMKEKYLVLVLATFESMFLSHMSLMVQPAPRMIMAPAPKRATNCKSEETKTFRHIEIIHNRMAEP